jgi:hypothetical protein
MRFLVFEVITPVTVKNAVFWDIKPSEKNITSTLKSPAG